MADELVESGGGAGQEFNGSQGCTAGVPLSQMPIMVTFSDGMLRATVHALTYSTFIGPDPKDDCHRALLRCFQAQSNNAAILALTPPKDRPHTPARNSNIGEPRPEETPAGRSDSKPAPWMPGDWGRR